jgi:RNA polymerase II subunit A small phosphatase-like protein
MTADDRILLILDVDETLVFATEQKLDREPDCIVGPYHVYRRPHLEAFLRACRQQFKLAIWSSSTVDYAEAVVRATFPAGIEPIFIWHRKHCVQRFDVERHETYFVKDLKKLKRRGFSLERVLIVEDTPQKVQRNYGNAIYVTPFYGDPEDDELQRLATYLESLRSASNVRSIEKRGWRRR